MIKVNGFLVNVGHFPDGTQSIKFEKNYKLIYEDDNEDFIPNTIEWYYDSDEEMFTLSCTVDWVKRTTKNERIKLFMPYLPNARMDRIKNNDENFSLKFFANFINSFNFSEVECYNVHSNVGIALINNLNLDYAQYLPGIEYGVNSYPSPDVIFFPDEGACKRYSDNYIIKSMNLPIAFGIKKRDWTSGKILGLDVVCDIDLTGKRVLIVDDICSAGGTFKFSAIKLKELGASDVQLYVTHCEDNIQNGDLLKTDLISQIYTTDSILHIEDSKIQIVTRFRK